MDLLFVIHVWFRISADKWIVLARTHLGISSPFYLWDEKLVSKRRLINIIRRIPKICFPAGVCPSHSCSSLLKFPTRNWLFKIHHWWPHIVWNDATEFTLPERLAGYAPYHMSDKGFGLMWHLKSIIFPHFEPGVLLSSLLQHKSSSLQRVSSTQFRSGAMALEVQKWFLNVVVDGGVTKGKQTIHYSSGALGR